MTEMEDLAIKINTISELSFYESYPNWKFPNNRMISAYYNTLKSALKQLDDTPINRIYFGSEFCELALPSKKDIEIVSDYCRNNELKLTLLLPPLSDSCFENAVNLIQSCINRFSTLDFEISCGDLGTLFFLSKNYKNISLLRGRALQKRIYDPRLDKRAFNCQLTNESLKILHSSSISLREMDILHKLNVKRIEIDLFSEELLYEITCEFPNSLYLPFGLYTTGHMCLQRNLGLAEKEKFHLNTTSCTKSCRKYYQTMNKSVTKSETFITENIYLFRYGNTVYYNNQIEGAKTMLLNSRIVLQPYPML